MAIRKSDRIREEVRKRYNKDPRGWHVLIGGSDDNLLNSVVLNGKDMWVIKEEFLNPFKTIGYGKRVRTTEEFEPLLKNPYSYGFRPLTPDQGKRVLGDDKGTILEILEGKPLSNNEVTSLALEGPIITTRKLPFSDRQRDLDKRLRKMLRKLVLKEHPDLMKGYI